MILALLRPDGSSQLQVQISGDSPGAVVLGGNLTLTCQVSVAHPPANGRHAVLSQARVKWSFLSENLETDILVMRGEQVKISDVYKGRVLLLDHDNSPGNRTLRLEALRPNDSGVYRCQVQQGLEDADDVMQVKVKGVVFHYRGASSRYSFTFLQARRACEEIGAQMASPDQVLAAYHGGYEQCDAGWLSDQSVRYPIQTPREGCFGDMDGLPGVRNYGMMDPNELFDVYCYVEDIAGTVFHGSIPQRFTFLEAKTFCHSQGAQLATPAQLHAAWNEGLNHCSPGWLADRSVRYPIVTPRERCGGGEPGVRTVYRFSNQTVFPEENSRHDTYCFRGDLGLYTYSPLGQAATEPGDINPDSNSLETSLDHHQVQTLEPLENHVSAFLGSVDDETRSQEPELINQNPGSEVHSGSDDPSEIVDSTVFRRTDAHGWVSQLSEEVLQEVTHPGLHAETHRVKQSSLSTQAPETGPAAPDGSTVPAGGTFQMSSPSDDPHDEDQPVLTERRGQLSKYLLAIVPPSPEVTTILSASHSGYGAGPLLDPLHLSAAPAGSAGEGSGSGQNPHVKPMFDTTFNPEPATELEMKGILILQPTSTPDHGAPHESRTNGDINTDPPVTRDEAVTRSFTEGSSAESSSDFTQTSTVLSQAADEERKGLMAVCDLEMESLSPERNRTMSVSPGSQFLLAQVPSAPTLWSADSCLDSPCLNGGTCVDEEPTRCVCLPGYKGDVCQTDVDQCELGWEKFHGHCYRHFVQRQSWETAERHCRLFGSHLISLMSPEEQDFINDRYREYQWIGLNDRTIEGDFRWSDGNPLPYENWHHGQPDSYFLSGEDCAVMVWHDGGRWSDVPCNYHLSYTCKRSSSSCGDPPEVPHARIFGTRMRRYEINTRVRYYCMDGFQQKLDPVIRCLPGGQWEEPQVTCIPVSPSPEHGLSPTSSSPPGPHQIPEEAADLFRIIDQ
ncbi:brevican core protein [Synchiropus picturatus]